MIRFSFKKPKTTTNFYWVYCFNSSSQQIMPLLIAQTLLEKYSHNSNRPPHSMKPIKYVCGDLLSLVWMPPTLHCPKFLLGSISKLKSQKSKFCSNKAVPKIGMNTNTYIFHMPVNEEFKRHLNSNFCRPFFDDLKIKQNFRRLFVSSILHLNTIGILILNQYFFKKLRGKNYSNACFI